MSHWKSLIFLCVWRHNCQFKPQQFWIVFLPCICVLLFEKGSATYVSNSSYFFFLCCLTYKKFFISGVNMASRRHECKKYCKPDSFCYVCGCYTLLRQRCNMTLFVKRVYKAYFQIPLGDQWKKCSSHMVCHNCDEMLHDWTKGKRKGLPVLEFPWLSGNPEIMWLTAILASSTRKVLARKIGIRSPVQAFPPPFDVFHIVKNFRSRFLLFFPHVKTVIMTRESMRAAKTRWFLNLNPSQMTPIDYQPLGRFGKRNWMT